MIKQCDYFQKIALGRVLDFLIFDQLLGKEGEGGGGKKMSISEFHFSQSIYFQKFKNAMCTRFFSFLVPLVFKISTFRSNSAQTLPSWVGGLKSKQKNLFQSI